MAAPTYNVRALVLRKTKLAESDLVLTLLSEDGSQLRAVAKSARKPQSPFSSRLELFCVVDLLCAEGRSLDIVKEARMVQGAPSLRSDILRSSAAASLAELLCKVAQPGLENARLFDSTSAAIDAMCRCREQAVPALAASQLLKILAYAGFQPNFDACVVCGCPVAGDARETVSFCYADGGVVCDSCRGDVDAHPLMLADIGWSRTLLMSRFSSICESPPPLDASIAVLRVAQGLIRSHVGSRLKSLDYLLSFGLTL